MDCCTLDRLRPSNVLVSNLPEAPSLCICDFGDSMCDSAKCRWRAGAYLHIIERGAVGWRSPELSGLDGEISDVSDDKHPSRFVVLTSVLTQSKVFGAVFVVKIPLNRILSFA